jgi:Fe-S oxidoreductase
LLKAALSNDLTQEALRDPTLADAMDLCVSCKGCKRECEANVDMALIKVEYRAQRAAQEGVRLRERLLAHTPRWLHRAPWLKPLIRWRNRSPLLMRLSERWMGLSAQRQLPEPAPRPYAPSPLSGVTASVPVEGRPEVVLWIDTFTHHFEPEIAEAAVTVLRAGGYSVQVARPEASSPEPARPLCCGRTYLVQGMLDEARTEVRRLSEALRPQIEAGRIVVGLEASCVVNLRDDAQTLGLGDAVDAMGPHVLLFEEFLAREIMAKRLNLPLRALKGTETLVHGHCHQKAVGAMKAMRRVLKLIPDLNFSMIEAGCCGMAGTFGLEAEHAEMASAMAEQDLMPILRDQPTAQVIANGFSCRQQMRAHGDTRPRHLAVLLREALVEA